MRANTQIQASKSTDRDKQIQRLVKVKSIIGDINYTTIYAYEFNEKLTEEEIIHMRNFWGYKVADLKLLCRFEWIAENIKRIPNIAKQKA